MSIVEKILSFVAGLFKKAPSLKALILNVAVLVAVKLGWHNVTTTELLGIVSAAFALIHSLTGLGVEKAKAEVASAARSVGRFEGRGQAAEAKAADPAK